MRGLILILLLTGCNAATNLCIKGELYICDKSQGNACIKQLGQSGEPTYCVVNPEIKIKKEE